MLVLARRREEPVQRREGRVARVEHSLDRVALNAAALKRLLHRALLDGRGEQQVLRLDLGASLVQVYTGLIFQGPRLVQEIAQALAPGISD